MHVHPTVLLLLLLLSMPLSGCGSLIVTQQSVDDLAGRSGFTWEKHEFDGFVIHAEPGSVCAAGMAELAADAEAGRERVLAYLRRPAYEPTVSIFAVDTRARMRDLVGRETNATAYHTSNALCLVWPRSRRSGTTHELLHIVAMNEWGVPDRWVNEGAAVDATGPWQGLDVHAVCKRMKADGTLPSLDAVTRRFGRMPSKQSYPAAGSFVRYLRQTHGFDALRQTWDGGRSALPAVTGLDGPALEAAWHAAIDRADAEGVEYDIGD